MSHMGGRAGEPTVRNRMTHTRHFFAAAANTALSPYDAGHGETPLPRRFGICIDAYAMRRLNSIHAGITICSRTSLYCRNKYFASYLIQKYLWQSNLMIELYHINIIITIFKEIFQPGRSLSFLQTAVLLSIPLFNFVSC